MCSRRRRSGADLAYLGTRFIATDEANAPAGYKQMLIDSRAEDIVYTSLFSGVARQLSARQRRSTPGSTRTICPRADKTKMNFGSGGNTELKAWKDIWSAGQSVSGIHEVEAVAALVDAHGARIRRRARAAIELAIAAPTLRLNARSVARRARARGLSRHLSGVGR